jgi:hypothetical protein
MALKEENEITIPVVYGEAIVDGLKIFEERVKVEGEEYYSLVYVLAEGPIHAFNQIRLNEINLFNREMNVKSGVVGQADLNAKFKDHVQVVLVNGEDAGQRVTMIEQNSNNKWKQTATLNGRAAVCLKIRITDSSELKDPDFGLQAKIKGRPVIDVRFESTEPVYDYTNAPDAGTNPALCLLDYLTNSRYGASFPWNEIDVESFVKAANWCEVNSLTMNGVVNQNEEYKKNIEDMLSAFRGRLTRVNGIVQCVLDIPAVSIEHLDLDSTINKLKIEYNAQNKYFNQLEATYNTLSFDDRSVTVLYPPTNDDPFILKDNKVIKEDLKLPFTRTKNEVDFLASMMVRDNIAQTEIEFETVEKGYNIAVNDVFTITLETPLWENKAFRAVEVSYDIFGDNPLTVKIKAREYKHEVFDDAWDGVVIPPPVQEKVPAVTNLAFEFVDSKYGITGKLTWDRNVKVYETKVMYKLAAEPDTAFKLYSTVKTNEAIVSNLKNAYYDFYVVNLDLFTRTSDIVYLRNVNCYDATLLPKITNLIAHTDTADFVFTWDDMLEHDIKISDPSDPSTVGSGKVKDVFLGYEIDVLVGNQIVGSFLTQENKFIYTFENNQRKGLSRSITINASIASKHGARSQAVILQALNPQQPVPNGLSVTGGLSGLTVKFDAPQQTDHRGVLVHLSKTRGFVPNGTTLLADLTATNFLNHVVNDSDTYFVRVGAYDCFGKDSIVYSPEFEVSIVDVNSMLEDISSDQLSQELIAVITGKADTVTVNSDLQAAKDLLNQKVLDAKTELQTAIDDSVVDLAPVNAKIIQVEQASINADNALTSQVNGLVSTTNSNTATIASLSSTVTNNNTSISSRVNTMESSVTTLQAPSGLAHRADITVAGDPNTYYPVYFKYGNQDFTRRLIIQRSYWEQAPVNWSGNTTHKGGLVLDILGNWGGWGGQSLDWRITELKQQYSTMYGGATITGNNMMFVVWLRGGEGVYHLHSDQALDVQIGYSTNDIIRPDNNPAYVIRALPAKTTAATAAEINAKYVSDKAYIGLDQVDNKSSATIVSEAATHTDAKFNETIVLLNNEKTASASARSTLETSVKTYADTKKNEAVSHTNAKFDEAIDTINSKDSARASQITTVEANVTKDINSRGNLLQKYMENWKVGKHPVDCGMGINGASDENRFVLGDDPFGSKSVLWEMNTNSNANSDGDGGIGSAVFACDSKKSYRYSLYVKKSATGGTTYIGCGGTPHLDGSINSNPYFWAGGLGNDKWYLMVGILQADNGSIDSGLSGVYDCETGARIVAGTDFKMSAGATTQHLRAYLYYSTNTAAKQYFWNPRVDVIDGNEPSLTSLMPNVATNAYASVTQTSSALATLNGRVNATWALRLAAGNKISGIGLANDGTSSAFSVLADSFKIYANGADNAVFAVENGVLVVKSAHIGQLDSANIKAGAIDAAHIAANTITGDKIQAGTKIVSPIIEGGQVRLLGTNYMEISSATPFGPDNLVKWCGAKIMSGTEPNWTLLKKSNATQYVTANGDAYFGGSLSAGVLKTGVTNTQHTPYTVGTYGVEIGPFGSNGRTKSVIVSYYAYGHSSSTTNPGSNPTAPSLGWSLERSVNSGAWTAVSSGTFTGYTTSEYEAEDGKYHTSSHVNGSQTYTDTSAVVGNYAYRIKIISFTRFHTTANINSQELSLISTEQ